MSGFTGQDAGFVAGLDPRMRIVAALAAVCVVAVLQRPSVQGLALTGALALCALARLAPGTLIRRLLHLEGFLLLLLVMLPFTVPGPAVMAVAGLPVSAAGLRRAGTLVLRINAAALSVTALLGTMELVRLGQGLAGLGVPAPLVQVLLIMVRYLDILRGESVRLGEAMRARGFRARAGLHTWRSIGNRIGMMVVRALERAARVDEAMRARGYAGRMPVDAPFTLKARDGVFAGLLVGALLLLLLADRGT